MAGKCDLKHGNERRFPSFLRSLLSRRYIDDVFMTWNRPIDELRKLLNQAKQSHQNIKFDYQIGQCLPFLDVLIKNQNGLLHTSVYHKPSSEPYITPFRSDHPRHMFGNIIQGALTRAIRYSSTLEIFDHERRCIHLKLLYNGYLPLLWI